MSAFLVTTTHIRALVSAARWDTYAQTPAPPRAMLDRYPEAFAGLIRSNGVGPGQKWWLNYEDEFGRALYLANLDSLRARYSRPEQQADHDAELPDVLGYRHALVELPPAAIIKACDCYSYQACEVHNWDGSWPQLACAAIREAAIQRLTADQPWTVEDPPGGAPVPGTAGAPVSLMSLVRR